jgi:hypothetical protein
VTEAKWTSGAETPLFEKIQALRAKVERLRDLAVKDAEAKVAALTEMAKTHATVGRKSDG